jgi:hypothetical protein
MNELDQEQHKASSRMQNVHYESDSEDSLGQQNVTHRNKVPGTLNTNESVLNSKSSHLRGGAASRRNYENQTSN